MRDNFDACRLILAIAVIYSHSFALAGQAEWIVYDHSIGAMAVHGFFCISGYLVCRSFNASTSVWSFLAKRALRIAPALVVACVASHALWVTFDRYATNPIPYISNGPVWTLSWEAACYALCAALGVVGILQQRAFMPFFAAAWLVFAFHSGERDSSAITVIVPMFMLFLGGAAVAVHEQSFDLRRVFPFAATVLVIAYIPSAVTWIFDMGKGIFLFGPKVSDIQIRNLAYVLVLPVVVITICKYTKPIRIPVDVSYGTYLYGWPVSQVIVAICIKNGFAVKPIPLFTATLAITLVVAYVSWLAVEHPASILKTRFSHHMKPKGL